MVTIDLFWEARMTIQCVWEHNGEDTLLYAVGYIGAYARGESLSVAAEKLPQEIASYGCQEQKQALRP